MAKGTQEAVPKLPELPKEAALPGSPFSTSRTLKPSRCKMKRATDADDAGADHGDGFGHQFGENETVEGISSMPMVLSDALMRVSLWPSRMFHSAQRLRNFCQRWSSSRRRPM